MQIETPFPVEGTVKVRSESHVSFELPCESEWLDEHESGDILERVRREVETHHRTGKQATFIAYEDGRHEITEVSDLEEEA
jgi:hypothetical protein